MALISDPWQILLLVIVSAAAGWTAYGLLLIALKRFFPNSDSLLPIGSIHALRVIFPLLILNMLFPLVKIKPAMEPVIGHITAICWVLSLAWLVTRIPAALKAYLLRNHQMTGKGSAHTRTLYTQLEVFQKIVIFAVSVLSLAAILMSFERVRALGASILASAGIVGIIAGFAGQKIFANLLAGIQIALSQPIRIEDAVLVENEWGWIEEITLTYVVVKTWDLRRVILPISYFIEKPFQNWTRSSEALLGAVTLYTDYTLPIEPVRSELHRILTASPSWNGETWSLQVTNASEHAVELRALVSADDAAHLWNLRCEVREKLITFIGIHFPEALPLRRLTVTAGAKSAQMLFEPAVNNDHGRQ